MVSIEHTSYSLAGGPCLALGDFRSHGRPARVCLVWAVVLLASGIPARGADRPVADICRILTLLPETAEPVRIEAADVRVPPGGHLQGVQLLGGIDGNHLILSHDSLSEAYLVVARMAASPTESGRVIHVQPLPSDGKSPPLRHAGGMQLAGTVLAVGVEDNQQKQRSVIQFWEFSRHRQPLMLEHLTIQRSGSEPKDMTAGAVGLVPRQQDFLLAVANWDSRAIDFYTSNGKPLGDRNCRFDFHSRWEEPRAEKGDWLGGTRFGAYQSTNLIVDIAGRMGLVGFATTPAGQDMVDLFVVEMEQPPTRRLRKIASKIMQLVPGNHFRFAAGLAIDDQHAAVLASPHRLQGQTTLSIVRRAEAGAADSSQ